MSVVQEYAQSVLVPQLHSLGLSERQREIVVADVTMRLESLLSHWHDPSFRRTILVVGTEEGSFWEPLDASLEIRSLVVVAVRNSLIEDLHASCAYTEALRSGKPPLPNDRMPWITGQAIKHFQARNLDAEHVQPTKELFGSLPRRFPNAWHVLSLLGNSPDTEIEFESQVAEPESMDFSAPRRTKKHTVIVSGIDPGLDSVLANALRQIERGESDLFFSSAFKGITRNVEKLFSVIDHVLRFGGTVLTPNYLLSLRYVARRDPLLRPAHTSSEIGMQLANPIGLSGRHKGALASLSC